MHRTKQQSSLRRPVLAVAVVATIALLLVLSVALATSAGHGFNHIDLALPVLYFLVLLTAFTGERLATQDLVVETKVFVSARRTRAPPAPLP